MPEVNQVHTIDRQSRGDFLMDLGEKVNQGWSVIGYSFSLSDGYSALLTRRIDPRKQGSAFTGILKDARKETNRKIQEGEL